MNGHLQVQNSVTREVRHLTGLTRPHSDTGHTHSTEIKFETVGTYNLGQILNTTKQFCQ